MVQDELQECFLPFSVPHVQMSSGMSSMLLACFISLFVVGDDDIDGTGDPTALPHEEKFKGVNTSGPQ